jgi:predicted unusual protein kinase regulating ubiquinone biosynthesis (AarF/ABC1/UbiB family)
LSELGTTGIKFGQMLSLHPDLVGNDVAAELARLQSNVPPDPPGSAESTIKFELGVDVGDAFDTFEATPMASASVAQAHRASLKDGMPVVVKVVHSGAQAKVQDDLELMRVLAGFVEDRDEALAAYSPTVVVDEFDTMMRAAIDLGQELANLQLFTANFADEHDVVIPRPYPEVSSKSVLTMSLLTGTKATGHDSVIATGWDVDDLVRRASNIYLEMVFRDGVYHADPHRGNFLLPDGQHLAILDFGDIGHLRGPRKNQLEALLMAVGSRDVDEITDIVIDITHAPADIDSDRLSGQLEAWLSRYLGGSVANLDFVGMVNSGMQIMHSNRLTFPSDLALLFRVFVQLQGLGSSVGANVSLTELLQPYWEEMMLDRLSPVSVGRRALRTLRRLGASTRHGTHEASADPPTTPRRNNRCRIPNPRRRWGNRPINRWHPRSGLYPRLTRTHRPADRSTDPRRVHPRSDRAHRWCGHLATPASQSRRPPQQLQPHSPTRRPAVPRECASPKLAALNRWTLIVLRIDGRYDLDDGRPLERRDHGLSFLIPRRAILMTSGIPDFRKRPPALPEPVSTGQRPCPRD